MDLLLHKDLILQYFKNLNRLDLDGNEQYVEKIMKNNNNNFLLSRNIITHLKEIIPKDDPVRNFFEQFILKIISERRVTNPPPSSDCYNYEEEFMYLSQNHANDLLFIISFYNYRYLESKLSNIASIININKPNFHWVVVNLAANSPLPITVRYFDFNSNTEINHFFEIIFNLPSKINVINIFDRNCNLGHSYFDSIINKGILIRYYTAQKRIFSDTVFCRNQIKSKFINRYSMFITDIHNIHERRIIFNNLIIDTDEDFWNLEFDRPTWKIDITYCELTANELLKKRSLFRRF